MAEMAEYKVLTRVKQNAYNLNNESVCIYKTSGDINISKKAHRAVGSPQYVQLQINQRERILRIVPARPDVEGAVRLISRQRSHSFFINSKSFCESLGFKPDRFRRFKTGIADGAIVVYLNREIDERGQEIDSLDKISED